MTVPTWLVEFGVMATVTLGLCTIVAACPTYPASWPPLKPAPTHAVVACPTRH